MRDVIAALLFIVWIKLQTVRAAHHYGSDSGVKRWPAAHHHDSQQLGVHSRHLARTAKHRDRDIAVLGATGEISWKAKTGRSPRGASLLRSEDANDETYENKSSSKDESMPKALQDHLSAQGISNETIVCSKPSNDTEDSDVTCQTENGTKVSKWSCDSDARICCNPALRDIFYRACLATACPKVESDPACSKYGMCTKTCGLNCCCFVAGSINWVRSAYISVNTKGMRSVMAVMAVFSGLRSNSSSASAAQDSAEEMTFIWTTMCEVLTLLFGLPIGSFFIAQFYEQIMKRAREVLRKVLKRENLRTDAMTAEMRAQMMEDAKFAQREKLKEYVGDKDLEGLGGIQQMLVTEVSGMSAFKWARTQMLSLSLYYFVVKEPVEVNVCVLGKSGRLLVVTRKPMYPADEAAVLLMAAGQSISFCTIMGLLYLRSIERVCYLAETISDPAVKARAAPVASLCKTINGKVLLYVFLGFSSLWLFNLLLGRMRIKMWGYSDTKNYYESETASCAQYFRTGIKGLPGVKPRRVGGMRIFFGPYPLSRIWWQLGRQYKFLKCLEPLAKLPVELNSDGVPKSGNGSPASPEDRAGMLQLGLALVNSFLGTLGLVFFAINIYNLLMNVQNCPTGSVVGACIKHGNCAGLARSPWFVHHLTDNELMTTDEMASEAIRSKVSIDEVGKWLKLSKVGETKKEVNNVAKAACADMESTLIGGAKDTAEGMYSDWLGKRHAQQYLDIVEQKNINITYDKETMHCKHCVKAMTLWYFSDVNNLIELFEIFLLMLGSYVASLVASMMADQLTNCPMVDVRFEADPTAGTKIDLNQVEVDCLGMMGASFFFRYHYSGTPENMNKLEADLQNKVDSKFDTTKLPDPWMFDTEAEIWDEYRLYDAKKGNCFLVNKKLLGLLDGEEVVSAWAVPPPFTSWEVACMMVGAIIGVGMPIYMAYTHKRILCAAEAVLGGFIHYALVDFFILKRRPASGIVMTTRRVFQITRTARYLTLVGYTEPFIKLDILLHDCSLYYGSLQMECFVPLWRRVLARLLRFQVHRRGQVISQGKVGIFKLWRRRGDTYNIVNYVSHITHVNALGTLNPKMGQVLMLEEKVAGDSEPPDPACACCTCPYTPPPMMLGTKASNLVDRYLVRAKGEQDVYGRRLTVRPSTCGQLCCGRGIAPRCECCWCCNLDEMITEFLVSSHRIVVEQRVAQRYCRIISCCRATPNIRCTFLALNQAAAYLAITPCRQLGLTRLQQDFTLKLLQSGAREYQPGLMLNQKPYIIFSEEDLPLKQKAWVGHINMIFDQLTQKQNEAESSEEEGGAEDNSEEDEFYDEMVAK
eukprot:TRINITY_DN29013_c0_g1_i1.p1 TRINITY_DN29013_c0_g1~~TRINITY_DN29013_c0_g1_i1.p1  ORF type:complete len:1325 (-),score=197.34 TRINITY_DN29013_c0_g1_i1:76-4050(-)